MENDMSDILKNVKNLVDSGNIPDNLKDIINNLQNNNSASNDSSNNTDANSDSGDNTSTNNITPDDFSKLFSSFTNSSNNNNNNNDGPAFDLNTMLKMKSIINAMNKKDDPRTNLLYSLKPYLRDSRKSKLDQYVNLLNMTKMADIFKANNKENNNDI